jgi:vacuolar-type H+-ATPase subunit I/STV1
MEKLKKIIFISSLILILGGCSMTKKFGNEEEAKKYVTEELEEKYGEEFAYNSELDKFSYDEYPTKDTFTGIFHPKSDSNKEVTVWVDSLGELKDDYAKYYFNEEAEKEISQKLDSFPFIKSEKVIFEARRTSEKVDKSITLDQYIKDTNATYRIELEFFDGETDEVYAENIKKIYQSLAEKIANYNLQIDVNGKAIFFDTVTAEMKEVKLEDIIEGIQSERRIDKLNEMEENE